jgi:hypothetical protein
MATSTTAVTEVADESALARNLRVTSELAKSLARPRRIIVPHVQNKRPREEEEEEDEDEEEEDDGERIAAELDEEEKSSGLAPLSKRRSVYDTFAAHQSTVVHRNPVVIQAHNEEEDVEPEEAPTKGKGKASAKKEQWQLAGLPSRPVLPRSQEECFGCVYGLDKKCVAMDSADFQELCEMPRQFIHNANPWQLAM